MFNLKVNDTSYQVPTAWDELPWPDYIKALNAQKLAPADDHANISVISALTGISSKLIRGMLQTQRDLLISLVQFYWDEEIPMHPIDERIAGIDIGLQSWDKMNRASIEFEAVAKAELHEWAAAQNVCKMYTEIEKGGFVISPAKDLSKMSVSEALPYAAFFLISSKRGLKRMPIYMLMNRTRTSLQQVSKSSKRLNGSARLSALREAIRSSTMNYLSNQRSTSIRHYCTSTIKRATMNDSETYKNTLAEIQSNNHLNI